MPFQPRLMLIALVTLIAGLLFFVRRGSCRGRNLRFLRTAGERQRQILRIARTMRRVAIEGAANNAAAFREEINGKNFTVTIAHLPAGKYTIAIGEVETLAGAAGRKGV